jgi:UDP-N-acetylglucosamine 2-epimerase (non-hydrolysing)
MVGPHRRQGPTHLTPEDYLIDNCSERTVNFILSTANRHHAWAGIRR